MAAGWSGAVDRLVRGMTAPEATSIAGSPPQFQPFPQDAMGANPNHGAELLALTNWWIEMMSSSANPLKEKLVLLLHSQFPTAYSKVNIPSLLYRQNQLFRSLGHGRFDTLMTAVSMDPAMLIWLDAGSDLKSHPNENFARELMERFTMGVGTYTEQDVYEAARAFTGWSLNYTTGEYQLNQGVQDLGWKTVLGHGGVLTGEQVIEIATNTHASHRWVVSRLWSWLAFPVGPHHPVVADLAPAYSENLRVGDLIKAMLLHPQFVSAEAQSGLVKQPVEYVVGALRAFHLGPADFVPGYLMQLLTAFGQQLFNPPNVGGWGSNQYWLSTASSLEQLRFANTLVSVADLSPVEDEPARTRVDALGELLGIDAWSSPTAAVLKTARGNTSELVSLALVSPEYVAN